MKADSRELQKANRPDSKEQQLKFNYERVQAKNLEIAKDSVARDLGSWLQVCLCAY